MMLPPLKACQCVVYTEEESDSTGLILQAEKARVIKKCLATAVTIHWTGLATGLDCMLSYGYD